MANATSALELTKTEQLLAARLATSMKLVAAVLLLFAVVKIVGGALGLIAGSPLGLLGVIEGAVTGLLGLVMLSSATDIRYMVETRFSSIHLVKAFSDLTAFYKIQLGLAVFLIVIACARFLFA